MTYCDLHFHLNNHCRIPHPINAQKNCQFNAHNKEEEWGLMELRFVEEE